MYLRSLLLHYHKMKIGPELTYVCLFTTSRAILRILACFISSVNQQIVWISLSTSSKGKITQFKKQEAVNTLG